MGSSSSSKHKHKKDKKHKRHRSSSSHTSDYHNLEATGGIDLTGDGDSNHVIHSRHQKNKKRKDYVREREPEMEVIAVSESDSDSSDCVEVPLTSNERQRSEESRDRSPPPPPRLSKHSDYSEKEYGRERERDRERERQRDSHAKDYSERRERDAKQSRSQSRDHVYDSRYSEYEERKRHHSSRQRSDRIERELKQRRSHSSDYDRIRRSVEREDERPKRKRSSYSRHEERSNHEHRERYSRSSERGYSGKYTDYDEDNIKRKRDNQYKQQRDGESYRHEDERIKRKRMAEYSQMDMHRKPEKKDGEGSPIPENGAGDCLSIEETNKLRAKLGLKPLEIDPKESKTDSTTKKASGEKDSLATFKDEWGEFLHKPADNLKEKAETEKLRDKLNQRKEKRFLEERLARIRTLGESDEEIDDAKKWVERNKRVLDEKKKSENRAKALEEMDEAFGANNVIDDKSKQMRNTVYTDKHLKGLKVDHSIDTFSEGKTVILTLKDAEVLDDRADDVLVNVNMLDDERSKKNIENKKKNPQNYGYNVYEEQYDAFGNPIDRGILEKYDEDIDGNKAKSNTFVLGENLQEELQHRRKVLEIKTKLSGKRLETLNDIQLTVASDTFSETELTKFKKPKKIVKKVRRQKLKADDLMPLADDESSGQQHLGSRSCNHNNLDKVENVSVTSIIPTTAVKLEEDDDELERILAKTRKLKQSSGNLRKPLSLDPEQIKAEIKAEQVDENASDDMTRDGHIILNATAEFCRTLGDIPTYGMAGNRDEDSNDIMDFEATDNTDERTVTQCNEPDLNHGTWNSVDPNEIVQPIDLDVIAEEVEDVAILDEEPDVGAGVANALRLALSKGYLEKEEKNRPSNSKMAHLQAKNYSIEDKTMGDEDKFGRRDRFHSGPIMDFKDKDNFKPNIKLEYIDDNGRILNLKEAFRYLSHKFHGKGPGKNKIEKRLKKMEQEGLMKTMSSTDTPLGTLNMLQQKQKETKAPYVLLSGGKQTGISSATTTISKFK